MLIGMTGAAGSGKSTAAAWLAGNHGFEMRSFAAPLKESAAALLGVEVEDLETWKNWPHATIRIEATRDSTHTFHPDHESSMTVREFLQRYGTESHRDVFGSDFWVDLSMRDIGFDYDARGVPVYPDIVWTDCRFPNEAAAIRKRAGRLIRIERPGAGVPGNHISEQPLPAEVTIENDGTLEELYEQLSEVVLEMKGGVW